MSRPLVLVVVVAALAFMMPVRPVLGQQPGMSTPIEKRFQAADPPAEAELLQVVLDFAPGAWTPVHTHGGPAYVTVLEGEMTLRMGDADETFRPGEGWIDNPDEPHAAGNEGAAAARVVVAFVLPKGATPTTVVETGAQTTLPPGPTTVAQFRMDAPELFRPLDVIQRVTEAAPGATVPMHTHPGPNLVTALQGSISLTMEGRVHSYQAGDNWVEPANVVHGGSVTGATPARLVTTTIVPRGVPVSSPAPQPAAAPAPAAAAPAAVQTKPAGAPVQTPRGLPRTGQAPAIVGAVVPAGLAGVALLLAGLAVRRRRGQ